MKQALAQQRQLAKVVESPNQTVKSQPQKETEEEGEEEDDYGDPSINEFILTVKLYNLRKTQVSLQSPLSRLNLPNPSRRPKLKIQRTLR